MAEADRHRDADFIFYALCEAAHADGGRAVVQAFGAGKIEEGLVDGDRFDKRRQVAHQCADVVGDTRIF